MVGVLFLSKLRIISLLHQVRVVLSPLPAAQLSLSRCRSCQDQHLDQCPMPSLLTALLPIQMLLLPAACFKIREIKKAGASMLNCHQSLKIRPDLLICYFTRFWRRRCCWSFREKVTDEHVCAHRGPRAAALKCAAQI